MGVDVLRSQTAGFRHAQPCGVHAHQDAAVLQAASRCQQCFDLAATEDFGQTLVAAWNSKMLHFYWTAQRDAVQKFQTGTDLPEGLSGYLALFDQVQQVLTNLRLAHLCRRAPVKTSELPRIQQIDLAGGSAISTQFQILFHAITELSHGLVSFSCLAQRGNRHGATKLLRRLLREHQHRRQATR
jgi:hypothetical protein